MSSISLFSEFESLNITERGSIINEIRRKIQYTIKKIAAMNPLKILKHDFMVGAF